MIGMTHSGLVTSPEDEVQEKLAELVERCKEVAHFVGEGREVFAECSYCHGAVPLWEALFTQQITGVLAHLSCPPDMLSHVVGAAAPGPEFDYASLVKAVDERMVAAFRPERSGEIELPPSPKDAPDPS
jgi:hypothetical protein